MYSDLPNYIIGFHGTSRKTAEAIIYDNQPFSISENDYDWLGHGSYFWEQNHNRALHFAKNIKKINNPVVVGAVIKLGNCLNLLDDKYIRIVRDSYRYYKAITEQAGRELPKNRSLKNCEDLIFRDLDCSVIHTAIELLEEKKEGRPAHNIDSVRGAFWEGEELYPNAGFREFNHIQICIRNQECIKGCFWPKIP